MLNGADFEFATEFYEVEKTLEVVVDLVGSARYVRIEALRDAKGSYSTRAYILESVRITPAYESSLREMRIWADYELPWTSRDSADEVLAQALSFLRERCEK